MNNFDKVFRAVKGHCIKQTRFAEIRSFDAIAKEANVPVDKLATYLGHLQDLDLIKYSLTDRYIYLTNSGKKHEAAIPET